MLSHINFQYISKTSIDEPAPNQRVPNGAIELKEGEVINLQSNYTLAYKNVEIETHMPARTVWQRIKNYFLGTENLFTNSFIGLFNSSPSWILLDENFYHQIVEYNLTEENPGLVITQKSYVGSSENVDVKTSYEGITGVFKGYGISTSTVNLKPDTTEKTGRVFIRSLYGPIRALKVSPDEPLFVNNDALVGYTEGLDCKLKMFGDNLSSFLLSSERLMCEFEGEGYVFTGGGRNFEKQKIPSSKLVTFTSTSHRHRPHTTTHVSA